MISTSRTSDFQISGSAISSHKNIHIQEEMENRGFSEDEISIITKFIEANGKTENSVEVAITDAQTILSKLNEEQGVEKIRKGIEVIRKIVQ